MGKYDHLSDKEKRDKIEELKKKISETKAEYDYFKAMQLALKLILNGTYGAFGHPAFSVSNSNIANAITSMAREVINYMLDSIEDYFFNKWHNDKELHELLGVVYISEKDKKYFYHKRNGDLIDKKGRENVSDILKWYNLTEEDIVENDKDFFIIGENKYKVIHKIFIHDFSNVKAFSQEYLVKPVKESIDGDKKRGVRKAGLIRYGDTDSLYISFTPIIESVGYKGNELKFIHHVNSVFVKYLFNDMLEIYAKKYNVKNLHDFELETINASGLHIQKKHYINNAVWEDGVYYDNLTHFNTKGVEIVKSSTPLFVREKIWEFINYLFKNANNLDIREVLKIIKKIKKEFIDVSNKDDISMQTSLSNYEQKVMDDQNGVECVKGAHFSIKAAALHNYLLNKNSKFKTKFDLLRGGKIKYYYCKHPLGNRFAFLRSFHPNEIVEDEGLKVNWDEQFSKSFLSICNRFLDPIGLPLITKRVTAYTSLFNVKIEKKPEEVDLDDGDDTKDEIYIRQTDDVILVEEDIEEKSEPDIKPNISSSEDDYWDSDVKSDDKKKDDFWDDEDKEMFDAFYDENI